MTEKQKHLLMSIWEFDLFDRKNFAIDESYDNYQLWCDSRAETFDSRSVKSSIISDSDVGNRDEEDVCCRRSSRNHEAKSRAQTAKALYNQMCRFDCDPYLLISPFCFGAEGGVAADLRQPFRVLVHPQCPLICEIHSHLSEAEVIGLLAGRWDAVNKIMYVQLPFPCMSTTTIENNGSTDVEMDPEAEYKARQQADQMGLQILGWYHSHPRFKPNPSIIDVFNQQQYQSVMKDLPFLGLIISPYDKDCADGSALQQWFVVKRYDEDLSSGEIYMPVKVDIEVQGFLHNVEETYLNEQELEFNLHRFSPKKNKLSELVPESCTHNIATLKEEKTEVGEDVPATVKEEKSKKRKKRSTEKDDDYVEDISSDISHFVDVGSVARGCVNDDIQIIIPITQSQATDSSSTKCKISEDMSSIPANDMDVLHAITTVSSAEENSDRRSGRAKKPSEALLLMVEQKDHVFNERLPAKPVKAPKLIVAKIKEDIVPASPSPKKTKVKLSKKDKLSPEKEQQDVPIVKAKSSKKRSIEATVDSSETQIDRSVISVKKDESSASNEPSIYDNLILSLTDPHLSSAMHGRRLILHTPLVLRHVSSICIGLGFYYSRFKQRVDLNTNWRGSKKSDKLKETVRYWLSFFHAPGDCLDSPTQSHIRRYSDSLIAFFVDCWTDYSGLTGKLRKGTKSSNP